MKHIKHIWHLLVSPRLWAWLYPLLLIIPNICLDITENYSLLARVANLLLPLGVYWLIMGSWKRTGVLMVACFPLSVLAAFQIVLLFLYGESIIAIDMFMNVATTNVGEASELLGNLSVAIVTVLILYLPPLLPAIVQMCKGYVLERHQRLHVLRTGAAFTVAGILATLGACATERNYSARREIFPYNVMVNIYDAGRRANESLHYDQNSADFSHHALNSRPDSLRQVYVLVVGETSRAENWQLLGYGRETNPLLSRRDGVIAYDRVMSESNTTHKAVPMLLSSLTADNFGDSVAKIRSIFEAYNGAGYNTAFITNQLANHSYIDYYGGEAKDVQRVTNGMFPQYDGAVIDVFRQKLAKYGRGPLFVVIHTYGSHFNYHERYPADYAHFLPNKAVTANKANRRDLLNSYDNSIRYTDAVVDRLISALDSLHCQSALVYVSDHGEDIFDDSRERFLHASPTPTFHQLHVPLVMWMSPEYRAAHPEAYAQARANSHRRVSSTRTVFDTLLDLSGIGTSRSNAHRALTNKAYREDPRRYLTDYNEGVALSESGFKQIDIDNTAKLDASPRGTGYQARL